MRILLAVGIVCAALLVALFAYSSRDAERDAAADTRTETASATNVATNAAEELTSGQANVPDLDSADIEQAAARAAINPLDAASAKVPPGRIRIEARFVEDVPLLGSNARPREPIEDQAVTCEVTSAPERGPLKLLSTELGATRSGAVVLEFADPGVRPLRVRLALAGRELDNSLRGRHEFRRSDERARVDWEILVAPRKYVTAIAEDLLGRPIPRLELELGYARFDAQRLTPNSVTEQVATDADGRVALPPTRADSWRASTAHPEWIALGWGPRVGAERELRWVFARVASLRVNGFDALAAAHQVPAEVGNLYTLGYGGLDGGPVQGVADHMKQVRAELQRPPELLLDLESGEAQRLGITRWEDESEPDVLSFYGKSHFALDRLPAGVRLEAGVARLWKAGGAVAIESRGERRYRALVGNVQGRALVLEPGPSELDVELAPPVPPPEPPEYRDDLPFSNLFSREEGTHPFTVAPRFEGDANARCTIYMRPSASNPNPLGHECRGWRARNGEHEFKLTHTGAWDVFVEVRHPHPHVQVVRGVDAGAKRIEVPIALAPSARVRFTHGDARSSKTELVVTWTVDPELGGPRIAKGSYTMSEPVLAATATSDDTAGEETDRWHLDGWRKLRGGSAEAALPSGVPIEFEVSGTHASGQLFAPLRFGPVVLEGARYELSIADSLTGSIDVVVATTEEAARVDRVCVKEASGAYLAFRARGGADWTRTTPLGGVGATTLRGIPPGDATVVVFRHDGKSTQHALRVERAATTKLVLGEP